jgi:hypothetical protein
LSLSYITCFGLRGKAKASRQTYTQETTKLTKENRTEKHKWKSAECDHVQKKKKQKTSEADSFRNIKIKISYTPEDGLIGQNI